MRTHIRFVSSAAAALFASFSIATASEAQSLQRPVDAAPTPEPSLGALAASLNPSRTSSGGAARVYTNADLTMRPAPVAPTTPPFPEIAALSGVLEHPGVPPVAPAQEPGPEQYGVPYWDGYYGGYGSGSSGGWFNGSRRTLQPSVHLGIPGRFSIPSTASEIAVISSSSGAPRTNRIGVHGNGPGQSGGKAGSSRGGRSGSGRGHGGRGR